MNKQNEVYEYCVYTTMIAYNFIKYVIDLYQSFKLYIDTLNNSHLLGYDMNDIENVITMQLVCNGTCCKRVD